MPTETVGYPTSFPGRFSLALHVWREKRPGEGVVGYRGSKRYSTMGIILFLCKRVTRFSSNKKTTKRISLIFFCIQTTDPMRSGNK